MSVETNAAEDPESEAYIDMSDKAAVERWCKALSVTDEACGRRCRRSARASTR